MMISPWIGLKRKNILSKDKRVSSSWYKTPIQCPQKELLSYLSSPQYLWKGRFFIPSHLHWPQKGQFSYFSPTFLFTVPIGLARDLPPLPLRAQVGQHLYASFVVHVVLLYSLVTSNQFTSNLNMEDTSSFKMLVPTCKITWSHNTVHLNLNQHMVTMLVMVKIYKNYNISGLIFIPDFENRF